MTGAPGLRHGDRDRRASSGLLGAICFKGVTGGDIECRTALALVLWFSSLLDALSNSCRMSGR